MRGTKEFLLKGLLLTVVVLVMMWALNENKKIQMVRHKNYIKCVAEKVMNEVQCSLWVQFHK